MLNRCSVCGDLCRSEEAEFTCMKCGWGDTPEPLELKDLENSLELIYELGIQRGENTKRYTNGEINTNRTKSLKIIRSILAMVYQNMECAK